MPVLATASVSARATASARLWGRHLRRCCGPHSPREGGSRTGRVPAAGGNANAALLDNRTEDENASAGDRLLKLSRRSNHTAGPRSTQRPRTILFVPSQSGRSRGPGAAAHNSSQKPPRPVAVPPGTAASRTSGRGSSIVLAASARSFGCRLGAVGVGLDGEFDPGSGRTLAACFIHASRTIPGLRPLWESGERVSIT